MHKNSEECLDKDVFTSTVAYGNILSKYISCTLDECIWPGHFPIVLDDGVNFRF